MSTKSAIMSSATSPDSSSITASQLAPRLLPGEYASWRPRIEVYFMRIGVQSAVLKETPKWKELCALVKQWDEERDELLINMALGITNSVSTSTATSASTISDESSKTIMRQNVKELVNRSQRAYAALFESIPEELRTQVAHIPVGYAYGLWKWLEEKFQSTKEDSVNDLIKQWMELSQEDSESFDVYKSRVNKIFTLLEIAKEKPSDRQYSYTILDKLQPRYKVAVLALKAGDKLKEPSKINWEDITAFINSHERSEQRLGNEEIERTMIVKESHHVRKETSDKPKSFTDIQCFYCKKYGHSKRDCRKRKAAEGTSRNKESEGGPLSSSSTSGVKFEQVSAARGKNFYSELNDEDSEEESSKNKVTTRKSGNESHQVFMAATNRPTYAAQVKAGLQTKSIDAQIKKEKVIQQVSRETKPAERTFNNKSSLSTNYWGVDSMASLHISGNRNQFISLQPCSPVQVEVADGTFVTAQYKGSVKLKVKLSDMPQEVIIPIEDVYYNERFSANLLSWGALRLLNWEYHSTREGTHLITPGRNKIQLRTNGRVSVMASSNAAERVYGALGTLVCATTDDLILLHQRLGHVGFDKMIHIMKSGETLDVGKLAVTKEDLLKARKQIMECEACIQGKGTRTPFGHSGLDKGSEPVQVLHMDSFVIKLKLPNSGGKVKHEYGLTITDPYTEARWFAHSVSKDMITTHVIDIIRTAQTQSGRSVKRIYCDGGTEFINQKVKDFCRNQGIEIHHPPARTAQLNGIAERSVRTLKDGTRTLLIQSGLPMSFWTEAMKHFVYVWNRTHIGKATGSTPYKSFYKRAPSIKHLHVFGCNTYCHVPKEQRSTTFSPRMQPGIYLGHDDVQNCAIVYLLESKKIIRSRDVDCRQTTFTHASAVFHGDESTLQQMINNGFVETIHTVPTQGGNRINASVPVKEAKDSPSADKKVLVTPTDSPSVDVAVDNSETEFEVERLMDKRIKNRRIEYLVKWVGYPDDKSTWEPRSSLTDAQESIDEYEHSKANPQPPPIISSAMNDKADELDNDDDDTEPIVHMVMCALGCDPNQKDKVDKAEQLKRIEIAHAISVGVSLLDESTPVTYTQAISGSESKEWKSSMDKEYTSCENLGTWEKVSRDTLPKGTNILPCKWVYKKKTDENGILKEYKSRLTPKGFRQKYGVDYNEVFANTGMYKTMRLGLSLTAQLDNELDQADVPSAFLQSTVAEIIFMEMPEGYKEPGMVLKLKKSLYGLKQSPRNWYMLISKFIKDELGFTATVSDPCFFFKMSATNQPIFFFMFVDDFQVSYHKTDKAEWNQLKSQLIARFNTKDMGESKWILGMRIKRDRKARTITLDQELYITKALEKYGLNECRTVATPELLGQGVTDDSDGANGPANKERYMEIVGTLLYAAISTRPDIAHAVQQLTRFMQTPIQRHELAAERVLRYLAGTKDICLIFGRTKLNHHPSDSNSVTDPLVINAFTDADWANDRVDRKSITGWVTKINGDVISWASKKQRTIAQSTCEAELYAEAAGIQEILWQRGLLNELKLPVQNGSTVYGDNQSTITISKNGIKSERTKHIDVKYHFVTEQINEGTIKLQWVPTENQQADIFTKALARPQFERLRKELMSR
jgi:hypothetical protein